MHIRIYVIICVHICMYTYMYTQLINYIMTISYYYSTYYYTSGAFCLGAHFSICAYHPCAGAMLIFSVSFQV